MISLNVRASFEYRKIKVPERLVGGEGKWNDYNSRNYSNYSWPPHISELSRTDSRHDRLLVVVARYQQSSVNESLSVSLEKAPLNYHEFQFLQKEHMVLKKCLGQLKIFEF